MNKRETIISGRECILFDNASADCLLVQPVDDHDSELLEQEVKQIQALSDKPFSLVAFRVGDWNKELTPWPAPPVFGKVPFGDGAAAFEIRSGDQPGGGYDEPHGEGLWLPAGGRVCDHLHHQPEPGVSR